jgi:hypothetical protein
MTGIASVRIAVGGGLIREEALGQLRYAAWTPQ